MNFAVIEYSSKTGDIWRHTSTRPNYLADPQKEMDPTSFGCYVSALHGEHIPLTKLVNARSFKNRLIRKITSTWPDYSITYLAKFSVLMVVYEVGNGPALTRLVAKIKQTYPAIKVLGVPTQPYGLLKSQWDKDPTVLASLRDFMARCDIFLTIVKGTTAIWQKLTDTPVAYLPQPYPVTYVRQQFNQATTKQPIIFIPGVTDRPNIITGHDVARALQQKYPDYIIHVTRTPGLDLDLSHLQDSRYEIIDFLPWRQHLDYLATVKIVINTDFTQTRGRVQMDCAAVGTPSIGSDSDAQLDLFPDLSANPNTPLNDIIRQSSRLLTDQTYYQDAVKRAQAKLLFYNYNNSARRLSALINTI